DLEIIKMKQMKFQKLIIVIIALFIITSCSDKWLNDIEPQGKLLQVNYYQTDAEFESGMVAVYSMFKNQYWNGAWSSFYLYASIPSDDAVVHGGGLTDMPQLWDVDAFSATPLTAGLQRLWDRSYYGIYRANVLMESLDENSTDAMKIMAAEAQMLRGYFYFELFRFFGEVPLIDHILVPEEFDQVKVSKEEIFNLIVSDLKAAAEILPENWSGSDKYRMTKYAAHGLMGKVYMYMASPFYNLGEQNYTNAITELKKVIDEGSYSLLSDFDQVWSYTNEFNNETLIEMSYTYSTGEFWGNGADAESNVVQQLQGPRGLNANDTLQAGWGMDMITQDLVDAYREQGDSIRLHGTALAEWQMREWGITDFEKNEAYTGYYNFKRATWKALNPDGNFWGWGNNERILRLSDIYLLLAEAYNRTGNDTEALKNVNTVRNRVGLPNIESSGDQLLSDIKLERRLELAQEAQRFFDLVRWGDGPAVLGKLGFVAGKSEHYPIPQAEIDNSGSMLIQNEAY
nr:RagB/SusD family nutrient uptake outer membrane protein [Prolixibacteraceae bacterium]